MWVSLRNSSTLSRRCDGDGLSCELLVEVSGVVSEVTCGLNGGTSWGTEKRLDAFTQHFKRPAVLETSCESSINHPSIDVWDQNIHTTFLLYRTCDHGSQTSHNGQLYQIEIYTSSEWIIIHWCMVSYDRTIFGNLRVQKNLNIEKSSLKLFKWSS